MSKVAKVAVASAIVLVIGCIIGAVGFVAVFKNGTNSDSREYVTTEFDIEDDFRNINITAILNDIELKTSTDGACHVECLDYDDIEHDAYVDGDTLYVTSETEENRAHFSLLTFHSQSPRIILYLPENSYSDLSVEVTTGDLNVTEAFTFETVNARINTGDIDVSSLTCTDTFSINTVTADVDLIDVECGSLVYNGTTGDINFSNVVTAGDLSIEMTTGDINFDMCDGQNIYIDCVTGDIDLILLSDKSFDVDVTTGDSDYPSNGEGGICRVDVTTGDVDIEVAG